MSNDIYKETIHFQPNIL